jgi:hypothetical protein
MLSIVLVDNISLKKTRRMADFLMEGRGAISLLK